MDVSQIITLYTINFYCVCVCVCVSVCVSECTRVLSHVQLLVTPWTAARQAPVSMEFCRQEYWIGLPFPMPGALLAQGSNLHLLCLLH